MLDTRNFQLRDRDLRDVFVLFLKKKIIKDTEPFIPLLLIQRFCLPPRRDWFNNGVAC